MASETSFMDLPYEVLIQIFSHLTVEDIVMSVQHVSQQWREVVHDGVRWKCLVYAPKCIASENDIVTFLEQAPKLEVFFPEAPMTSNILQAVIRHCKFIKKLKLDVQKLPNRQVMQLLRECKLITHLHIIDHDAKCYTIKCFNTINKCPELTSLKLEGRISSAHHGVFKSIADGFPSLQHLDLKDLVGVYTSENLQYLIDQKKDQLVSYFSRIFPRLELCTKLKYLCIYGFVEVNSIIDLYVFRLPALMSLTLIGCRLRNKSNLNDFLCANELRKLNLCCSLGLRVLTKALLKNINHLMLKYCDEVTDDTLKVVSIQLEFLDIRGCSNLTDKGIGYLSKCHKIKYLDISYCSFLTLRTMTVVLYLESLEELKVDFPLIVSAINHRMPMRTKNLKSLTGVMRSCKEFQVDFKLLRNCIPSIRQLNYDYDILNDHIADELLCYYYEAPDEYDRWWDI